MMRYIFYYDVDVYDNDDELEKEEINIKLRKKHIFSYHLVLGGTNEREIHSYHLDRQK